MVDLKKFTKHDLARMMDYSILPKETREKEIREGCAKAREYHFAAFYSSTPFWTPVVKEELAGYDDIEIGTGIAFPFGSATPSVKAFEVEEAVRAGCTAVDLVMNVGALKDKRYEVTRQELQLFKKAAGKAVTKAILEVCYLTNDEIAAGCKMIAEAGIDWGKSSTGQFEGPTLEQVILMRETLKGSGVKLKVSGVKFPRPQNTLAFVRVGAERIGTRAAVEIVEAFDTLKAEGFMN